MSVDAKVLRKRRNIFVVVLMTLLLLVGFNPDFLSEQQPFDDPQNDVLAESTADSELARDVLERIPVKGRASKAGYARDEFGSGWATIGGCDTRNEMLKAQLSVVRLSVDGCIVLSGTLQDPYTGDEITFVRGVGSSDAVQIDHVVALSDAWQKGAQQLEFFTRVLFANDPLNLLAVDGPANQRKGDSDAASWLPPNKSYRCRYVARQIAVKEKYNLWVTAAEKAAMVRILNGCGEQRVPVASEIQPPTR
jgi:hypothetical protein